MWFLGHVHALSLEFCLRQKPGEVAGSLNKATVITQLLEFFFKFIPINIDLIVVSHSSTCLIIGMLVLL
jgi:ABC-type transport system involved in Fe-S cluster assembly fused permease/ATPase subunit